ncbi:hypothetical protein RhiirA5_419635 [Rhizophagus irregularis]|uniref:Uncharacterized protein n=3 Tax=Rhizophagus irregularis TaxID=588596 RepID=A0A2I1F0N4_9GLOM|nr:hypothetical protein GLOIN_2v1884603 [Rhizophagus irregularis DAOM 181602=DAOM 197198]EXX57874.1 hypothetical protein RirG_203090 [Rhizophagus irregularis DAOM 197198w]PKC06385.1 hypothetical protein RhiirA5_419635 [Rhizophagus irregularis]PKC62482.1 hypothetical protein RhiirA1_465094 [Rhizophagus irregularis]PKY27935.1 hypothetical protein RhiirB3_443852 [Rhizophagus irregularis]POG60009.1 hypothetical protein GLOIN_2v1884603 [Rhizophagus irregularis DAOM 181602=DAOM 197198]|eukprot:XP_025166875.1 hypothetical protein GLOIN_2v1884603 [Rhizophagus irregularis DAOM 181602=DAOM 197198]
MMYMYPGFNSFEGENSFVQAQGFAFQQFQQFHQQQNWNLYNQLTTDPFILETNNNILNSFDQDFVKYNFQQNLNFNSFNTKKRPNHIYSNYTIPSITSIISQHVTTNNINPMNFLSLSTTNNMITPPISSIPTKSSIGIDFNYNENTNLLTQSQSQPQLQPQLQPQNSIQSSDTLSYFTIPNKDTTILLQDILDGMKVMLTFRRLMIFS